MARTSMRYHANPEQATVSIPAGWLWVIQTPLACVLLPLPEHCTSGGVGTYAARADFLNAAAAILKSSTKRAYSRALASASGSRNR